ncbi:MAG: hypothetical protein ACXV2J_08615, partial [Actinomycetes bacterium]
LSDVYYPTIDNTNVETLQFVVTDGSTFTDLQSRDTTSGKPPRRAVRRRNREPAWARSAAAAKAISIAHGMRRRGYAPSQK